jgi:alkanesulfonate monooxygenase SsuD/methylene tetrahydromethanopterin reductase-like flavin-dependent oxidoreductase (luciferase family)
MRLGIVATPRRGSEPGSGAIVDQLVELAQQAEKLNFHGLWVTDSLGRGFPTLDPLVLLGALCSVTKSIELGTGVLQLPLRQPVELAHRVQSLYLLSNGRLRLGVGSGSTKVDFETVQADFEARFRTLPESLEIMQRVWRGEAVYGPAIFTWPGTEGGPPVLLGAWRSQRWIDLAANACQGWIASGIHGDWTDLEVGLKLYREAGGKRAIITNIFTDLRPDARRGPTAEHARITLYCTPAEARDKLRRLEDLGFDDAILTCPDGDPTQLEAIRALL